MVVFNCDKACKNIAETLRMWYVVTEVEPVNMRNLLKVLEPYMAAGTKNKYLHDYVLLVVSIEHEIKPLITINFLDIGKPYLEKHPLCLLFFPRNADWRERGIELFVFGDSEARAKTIISKIRGMEGVPAKVMFSEGELPNKARAPLQKMLKNLEK